MALSPEQLLLVQEVFRELENMDANPNPLRDATGDHGGDDWGEVHVFRQQARPPNIRTLQYLLVKLCVNFLPKKCSCL